MSKLVEKTDLLLEIGSLLMGAGANTERIRMTMYRIAEALECKLEAYITHRALTISVSDKEEREHISKIKRTPPHGVNFMIISGISRMSWKAREERWSIDQIKTDLVRIQNIKPYKRWQILFFVALAGASFCRLFGGEWMEMSVAFIATFAGLFTRQETHKGRFNPYICVMSGAMIASLISGLGVQLHIGDKPELAFATSVLFLIPGVPFINSFTDIIDGNVNSGIVRGTTAFIIAFSISLGMLAAMIIYNM